MSSDLTSVFFSLFALLVDCLFIFLNVYFLALFSDLETDNINPIELCKQVNTFAIAEIIGHAALTVCFLLTGSWAFLFLNIPLVAWNGYRYQNRKHLLDPTQIFRDLSPETKILFAKLGFYMVGFCVYLFYMVRAIIDSA